MDTTIVELNGQSLILAAGISFILQKLKLFLEKKLSPTWTYWTELLPLTAIVLGIAGSAGAEDDRRGGGRGDECKWTRH